MSPSFIRKHAVFIEAAVRHYDNTFPHAQHEADWKNGIIAYVIKLARQANNYSTETKDKSIWNTIYNQYNMAKKIKITKEFVIENKLSIYAALAEKEPVRGLSPKRYDLVEKARKQFEYAASSPSSSIWDAIERMYYGI